MKFILFLITLLSLGVAQAQNIDITMSTNLNLNCKFQKVIIKNPEYNFETFTKDQIKRDVKHSEYAYLAPKGKLLEFSAKEIVSIADGKTASRNHSNDSWRRRLY